MKRLRDVDASVAGGTSVSSPIVTDWLNDNSRSLLVVK
jgi:hypothetical protein